MPRNHEQKLKNKEASRKYRENHPDRVKNSQKAKYKHYKEDPILNLKRKWYNFKSDAKVRKKDMSITFEEYSATVIQPCWYCGELGKPYVGIDRIDSSKGYEEGNIAPCCEICNKMKIDQSFWDFVQRCETIANRMLLK